MRKSSVHFNHFEMLLGEKYLQTWKLKLSTTKTVSAVFHLNNNEAKRELKANFNNETCTSALSPNTSE